ncbi:MAG: HAD-IIIA family hydrolase [Sphingobacteriales bacterium]|nr:HAD-IIIA family hydrolase [Sphingobacteriales bacterium]MBP8193316.1 HAD-IIIA family hydrolase [Chitinophagales bacterium]
MLNINSNWTLFLDRDGVINKNIDGGYVLDWEQFEFLDGVLETMPKLARLFGRIIVVTNQQCIAKGLLTEEGLNEIHQNMMNMIELNGGRIDAVYFAPDMESETNTLRKPKNGMALLAKNDFPEIDFSKCIMVGDKLSDMKFAKSVGMTTFCISTSYKNSSLIDYKIPALGAILEYLNI